MHNQPMSPFRDILALDLDNTVADTFAPNSKGVGVEEACAGAVYRIFGDEGQIAFRAIGGLQNRAPGEFIRELVSRMHLDTSFRNCLDYVERRYSSLEKLVPKEFDLPLQYHQGSDRHDFMTEVFVRVKLEILFAEFGSNLPGGKRWPAPMDGLAELFEAVGEVNRRVTGNQRTPIKFGILSSGHTLFVKRCFKLWRIPKPAFIFTDDNTRGWSHLTAAERSKPNGLLLSAFIEGWSSMESGRKSGSHFDLSKLAGYKRRMLYFGDDPVKDRNLATKNGVPFFLYDPWKRVEVAPSGTAIVRSWHELAGQIRSEGEAFFHREVW